MDRMSKTIEISVYDLQELRNENKMLHEGQWRLHRLWSKDTKHIAELEEENKKLKEENELLKQCLDKLMFDADVVNVKIHWELWDYVYVRSDRQFKLNVKD